MFSLTAHFPFSSSVDRAQPAPRPSVRGLPSNEHGSSSPAPGEAAPPAEERAERGAERLFFVCCGGTITPPLPPLPRRFSRCRPVSVCLLLFFSPSILSLAHGELLWGLSPRLEKSSKEALERVKETG